MFSTIPFFITNASSGAPGPAPTPSLPAGYTFYVDASDSDSYPGTGTTWFDLSGNNYDMTLSSADVFVDNGGNDKYMDFEDGIAKYYVGGVVTDLPSAENGTWVFYTSPKNAEYVPGFDMYKTLLRSWSFGSHPVIISNDGYNLGTLAGPSFTTPFDIRTIPNVVTEPHMMAFKLKLDTTPNWTFFYDSYTSTAQASIDATPSPDPWTTASLGGWHNNDPSPTSYSQTWGKIWFAVYYPFLLSTAELNQVNDYIASRY
jgi:hypothetical protein